MCTYHAEGYHSGCEDLGEVDITRLCDLHFAACPSLQLQLEKVKRREADLRKRMVNVVEAFNVALEGYESRTRSLAEKSKMITNRCGLTAL